MMEGKTKANTERRHKHQREHEEDLLTRLLFELTDDNLSKASPFNSCRVWFVQLGYRREQSDELSDVSE